MSIRVFIIAAVALVFSACTAEQAGDDGTSWVGHSRGELIKALGEPQNRIEMIGGGEILVYEEKREVRLPAASHLSGSDYQRSGTFSEPARTIVMTCVKEFEVASDGVVKNARRREGTGCLD